MPEPAQHTSQPSSQPASRRLAVLTYGARAEPIAEAHVEGFRVHAAALQRILGLTASLHTAATTDAALATLRASAADTWLVLPTWRDKADKVLDLFTRLRLEAGSRKLLALDWSAQASSPHFAIVPLLDRYLKRQTYADPADYQRSFKGGYRLSDAVATWLELDLANWFVGSPLDPAHAHKVRRAWNFGAARRYLSLARAARLLAPPWRLRALAINRRLGLPSLDIQGEWYEHYRLACTKAAEPLAARWRATGVERVGRRRYLLELMHSRIVFSPFGWGEVCFRDYEAVACGALLVKPDMSHLTTSPDIFKPGETYVPVRWDLSDLEDRCAHYLLHPEKAARIARNARRVLVEYHTRGGFVADVHRALENL